METTDVQFLYLLPHQLSVSVTKTRLQVVIQDSFFKGSHFLIIATYLNSQVYFNNATSLVFGEKKYLKRVDGIN
jgi:hypothetical protein